MLGGNETKEDIFDILNHFNLMICLGLQISLTIYTEAAVRRYSPK